MTGNLQDAEIARRLRRQQQNEARRLARQQKKEREAARREARRQQRQGQRQRQRSERRAASAEPAGVGPGAAGGGGGGVGAGVDVNVGVHGAAAEVEDEWVRGGEAGRPPAGAAGRNTVPRKLEAYSWLQVIWERLVVGYCRPCSWFVAVGALIVSPS